MEIKILGIQLICLTCHHQRIERDERQHTTRRSNFLHRRNGHKDQGTRMLLNRSFSLESVEPEPHSDGLMNIVIAQDVNHHSLINVNKAEMLGKKYRVI